MKKFLAFIASLLIVGIIAFTIVAFTDGDPKKQKTESTASACDTTKASDKACQHHEGTTADGTKKHCCKEACKNDSTKTASGECTKPCKHHAGSTAEASTDKK